MSTHFAEYERARWLDIQQSRAAGASAHQLGPDAANLLATHDIYTTHIPRDPGSFGNFRRTQRIQNAHDLIASRAEETFATIPEFEAAVEEKRLGHTLAGVFAQVDRIEASNVHIPNPDIDDAGVNHGTVVAENTRWTTSESTEAASKLGIALGGLLHARRYQSVRTEGATVELRSLTEHQARSLARIIGALLEREYRQMGITLPPQKRSLQYWDSYGETFNPQMRRQLLEADAGYAQLIKRATYRYPEPLQPVNRPDYHLIVNDGAAPLQGIRDIFNGLIHAVRGSSRHNKEQDPDKAARPFIEQDIDLKRNPVSDEEEWQGPPSSRTLSSVERTQAESTAALAEARKHPIMTAIRGTGKAVGLAGAGVVDISLKAAEYGPLASRHAKQLAQDRRAWHAQREQFVQAHHQLDNHVAQRLVHI